MAGSDLPDGDFAILTYEAEWCAPCKLQLADIREFVASNPDLRIAIIRVEADVRKARGAEGGPERTDSPAEPGS